MAPDLLIHHVDNTLIKVTCSEDIRNELSDHFTYMAPNYQHQPKFKIGVWDGKIRLFKKRGNTLGAGLIGRLKEYCAEHEYSIEIDHEEKQNLNIDEITKFVASLNIPIEDFETRPYQLETIQCCLNESKALIVSATSSGKSFLVYSIIRYIDKPTLIIVPKISLAKQMATDFIEYGGDPASIHALYHGEEKNTKHQIVISTWQTAIKQPKEWFDRFDIIIGDEAHRCAAKSLIEVMMKCNARYRFAFTGTLGEEFVDQLLIESLFGPKFQFVTTKDLMDAGYISNLKIKAIVLQYPENIRKFACGQKKIIDYDSEIKYIIKNEVRNRFIVDLTKRLLGNTLIMFRMIEDHGDILHEMLKKENLNREIFYINGQVDANEREKMRQRIIASENAIVLASSGTYAEGVNIPSLNNIVTVHPTKSKTGVLQPIGRVLRKTKQKNEAVLYDIVDDMSWKKKQNTTLKHFLRRVGFYNEEQHPFKTYNVKINN